MRSQDEVQTHVQEYKEMRDQFADAEDEMAAEMAAAADAFGLAGGYDSD